MNDETPAKPPNSHPEANAECRMENAEGWGKADQSQPQARYEPSASQEIAYYSLVFLLCSSCAALVLLLCCSCASLLFPWGLRWRQVGSTEPVREFDSGGLVGIQRGSRFFMNLLPLAVRPARGGRAARGG